MNYWFSITFENGRYIHLKNMSKEMAKTMFEIAEYKTKILGIQSVGWGVM